jgi:2,4-dienoyl-CoA reductase (NADPH2)
VNPRACYETEILLTQAETPKRIAVVGAGPAGLSAAITASGRGHEVVLFDRSDRLGGQLHYAAAVPGKEEFKTLLRWFETMVEKSDIEARLGTAVSAEDLAGFDEVIVATGVTPRMPAIPADEGTQVLSYIDVLTGAEVGEKVAIIGAGGIGFDVAEYLTHAGESLTEHPDLWRAEWGVGDPETTRGGLARPHPAPSPRKVTLLQRKAQALGRGLGKTTGWIHRASLKMKGVEMVGGVNYERITQEGLEVSFGEARENPRLIEADTVVLCAGQESERSLADALEAAGLAPHVIGGADVAAELDAKRAIDQGVRLAAGL